MNADDEYRALFKVGDKVLVPFNSFFPWWISATVAEVTNGGSIMVAYTWLGYTSYRYIPRRDVSPKKIRK